MTTQSVDTGTDELLCEIEERVATITLNRPDARNALSDRLTPALRRMIKQCGDDPTVGSILITGAGAAFCAGGDVKGMGDGAPKTEISLEDRIANLRTKQRTLTGALVAVRKPTVAALPGPAAGAGMAIALACDIRIAAESAIMSTGYARIGLTGDYGIAWLLTRLAGTARARELMFLSGTDRRAALRGARPRQPRGARLRAAHDGDRPRPSTGAGSDIRLRPDQGQPRSCADVGPSRFDGPGSGKPGARRAHQRPQGSGSRLRGEAQAGVRGVVGNAEHGPLACFRLARSPGPRQKATGALHRMAFCETVPPALQRFRLGAIVCGWRCLSRV